MLTRETIQYFQLGMGYYVAGRFAVHARFNIIAGNLCHHAIEMFLKGKLVQTLGRKALKNDFSHGLPRIWEAFKSEIGDPPLDRFDETILKLQEFDGIRYPDKVIDQGAQISVTIGGPSLGTRPATVPHATVPSYDLVLGDIDELVKTIFDVCSINSDLCIPYMPNNPPATEYLGKNNASFAVAVNESRPVKSQHQMSRTVHLGQDHPKVIRESRPVGPNLQQAPTSD